MIAVLRAATTVVAAVLVAALAGCVPEPGASPAPSPSATVSASPSASPDPVASSAPPTAPAFAVPAECEALYSPAMLATLEAQVPPLNDPGVTLFSTQDVRALELLNTGIPTIRCSWGRPGDFGLATNVSVIDGADGEALQAALAAEGFACEPAFGGTRCVIEQQRLDLDDEVVTTGEQHFFRDGGWVSTAYITVLPEGYTQDIAETLWG